MKPIRPRGPLAHASAFLAAGKQMPCGVHKLAFQRATSSGRAGLVLALRSLELRAGAAVLVPTYHCPTMIAPLVLLGLRPTYYGIDADGLPLLPAWQFPAEDTPVAMIVSHLFDRARSLSTVLRWCERHGIALIEDCAHAPIGMAGERPAGHWGDLATASVSKFAPVPEMGLLCAQRAPTVCPPLALPDLRQQVKAVWDVLDTAAPHQEPKGLHLLVSWLRRWRSATRAPGPLPLQAKASGLAAAAASGGAAEESGAALRDCDMARVAQSPTWVAYRLAHEAFEAQTAATRRDNHAALLRALAGLRGVRPLFGPCPVDASPYAVPVWVDDADQVYAFLRNEGHAVYRWDRVWPGTPDLPCDQAPFWRRHVLQCLCHQSLKTDDMAKLGQGLAQCIG